MLLVPFFIVSKQLLVLLHVFFNTEIYWSSVPSSFLYQSRLENIKCTLYNQEFYATTSLQFQLTDTDEIHVSHTAGPSARTLFIIIFSPADWRKTQVNIDLNTASAPRSERWWAADDSAPSVCELSSSSNRANNYFSWKKAFFSHIWSVCSFVSLLKRT